ncbi:MAG: class I SAM-dependent methyltransferase [Rubrivivax sp.]|nr:class I SAM-dependent methyltransferase [Rubrivivax sp.]
MTAQHSIDFFDRQFVRQVQAHDFALNPFEQAALAHLRGEVLDFGCGIGNLSVAAARRGCTVWALDGSATAVAHLQRLAASEALPIDARQADLRDYAIDGDFDTVVAIGLLMFFDCPAAWRSLAALQARVRPGGTLIVNVLVEGTTYLDMFGASGHCLFSAEALVAAFADWQLLAVDKSEFGLDDGRCKRFVTVIASRPLT